MRPHGERRGCGVSLKLGCRCGSWGVAAGAGGVEASGPRSLGGGALVRCSRERSPRCAPRPPNGRWLGGQVERPREGLFSESGASRPGGDGDLAVAGRGVGPEVGRGDAGVCLPRSQLSSGREAAAEGVIRRWVAVTVATAWWEPQLVRAGCQPPSQSPPSSRSLRAGAPLGPCCRRGGGQRVNGLAQASEGPAEN